MTKKKRKWKKSGDEMGKRPGKNVPGKNVRLVSIKSNTVSKAISHSQKGRR